METAPYDVMARARMYESIEERVEKRARRDRHAYQRVMGEKTKDSAVYRPLAESR